MLISFHSHLGENSVCRGGSLCAAHGSREVELSDFPLFRESAPEAIHLVRLVNFWKFESAHLPSAVDFIVEAFKSLREFCENRLLGICAPPDDLGVPPPPDNRVVSGLPNAQEVCIRIEPLGEDCGSRTVETPRATAGSLVSR